MTTISPKRPSGSSVPSSSTMLVATPASGLPQPVSQPTPVTSSKPSLAFSATSTGSPTTRPVPSSRMIVLPSPGRTPVTASVASAIPYAATSCSGRKPYGLVSAEKAATPAGSIRSAPSIAIRIALKSMPSSWPGLIRRAA